MDYRVELDGKIWKKNAEKLTNSGKNFKGLSGSRYRKCSVFLFRPFVVF